jgi:translation initiation factor 4E
MMKLQSKWIIWQNSNEESDVKSWADDLKNVGEFSEVGQYKYLANEIENRKLSKLLSLKIFKSGIKPMWEDPKNMNGGRIVVDIPGISGLDVEKIWNMTVAFCISNTAPGICGCVFIGKQDLCKISLWIEDENYQPEVQEKWQDVLVMFDINMYFLLHKKSIDGNKSRKTWNKKKGNY